MSDVMAEDTAAGQLPSDVPEAENNQEHVNGAKPSDEEDEAKETALLLFKELGDSSQQTTAHVKNLINGLRSGQFDVTNGISLLDVKNHILGFYLVYMTQIIAMKATGKPIEGSPAILTLCELRVYLEKIRPVEMKLKYQLDKWLKVALTGGKDKNDPSQFRANPEDMKSKDSDEDDDFGSGVKKPGVYVPPKMCAVHYEGYEKAEKKKQKMLEAARRQALRSSVIGELKEEYLDTPTEIRATNTLKQKEDKYLKRKTEFEEEFMVRLPLTKEDKGRAKKIGALEAALAGEVTRFEDWSVLYGGEVRPPKKKPKKDKIKGKKKKKKIKM